MKPKLNVTQLLKNELFWILLICLTVHNVFFQVQNYYYLYNADSVTYYYAAQQLFHGHIDPGRPPIYPLIMKLFGLMNSTAPFKYLIYFQHVLFFLSIIPFYLIVRNTVKNRVLAIVAGIIYGVHPLLWSYTNALLAEPILISCMVGYLYLVINYCKLPSARKIFLLNILLFLLIMIKPVALILYGVMLVFWLVRFIQHKDLNFKRLILYSYTISLLLLLGYCGINKFQNNYFGISSVGHDNKFINVIFSDAYLTLPDQDFINTIDSTIHKGHYYTVYYLNNDRDKFQKGFEIFPLEFMSRNNMKGVYDIPSNHLGYSLPVTQKYIKQASLTKEYWTYNLRKIAEFKDLDLFYTKGIVIYIIVLLDFLGLVLLFILKKELHESKLLNFLIVMAFLSGFFVGGVIDGTYSRVLLPLLPFFIISFINQLDFFTSACGKTWSLIKERWK